MPTDRSIKQSTSFESGPSHVRHSNRPKRPKPNHRVNQTPGSPSKSSVQKDIDECRRLTIAIDELEKEIGVLIEQQAPTLLTIPGCGILTAAKIVGETGGIQRFKSSAAFARHTGTAPLPVWSSNHQRHRLSRVGNRQLNAALHRIAVTQIRVHKPAKTLFERRKAGGDGGLEALRVLKRHLANTIYKTLIADTQK